VKAIDSTMDWARVVSGLVLAFGLFHWSATALESDRGQRGLLVAAIVVAATIAADQLLLRRPRSGLMDRLGLRRPRVESVVVAGATAVPLLLVALFFVLTQPRAAPATFYPGWIALLPGLFAQAGVAEEVLFRAYLFGQVRIGRTFWHAATLSMLPFVGVHLLMFATMPWPVALAGIALAAIISFPQAYLFELGGNMIWAPAFLHFVIQAVPKILVFSDDAQAFALIWISASALVPLVVLARKTD
jgi:membrane protease YdiL (CAAX protease family)